jgi:Flp pilus assembly protein TadB
VAIRHSSGCAGDRLGLLAGAAVGAATVAVAGLAAAPLAILAVPAASRLAGRLSERTPQRRADPALPLTLDLLAAALGSGRPLNVALRVAAPAAGPANAAALGRVAGLLELGADPTAAWASVDDPNLLPVSLASRRSADSGARLAQGLEQLATDLRQQARTAAQERAHRAGVLVMLPLGLCFLPAFICIGVVPVVVGIANSAFAGMR